MAIKSSLFIYKRDELWKKFLVFILTIFSIIVDILKSFYCQFNDTAYVIRYFGYLLNK